MTMTGSQPPENKRSPQQVMQVSLILALIVMLVYVYLDLASYLDVDWLRSIPEPWNIDIIYILIILTAVPAAGIGFLLARRFKPQEPQRRIWSYFALGWTSWLLGEICGFIYRRFYETLPDVTLSDLFWIAGYIFFGFCLYHQYVLIYLRGNIYARRKLPPQVSFSIALFVIFLLPAIATIFLRQAGIGTDTIWLGTYLLILYPLCDLLAGLAAIWFFYLFRRGVLGIPWLGLLFFALSDGISSWYWMGGSNLLVPWSDTTLSMITDILYIGGYMIAALGCLSIYLKRKSGASGPKDQATADHTSL